MIANGHRTPDNLLLETERNNVQQVFILTRNRPLNGVQTRVYFLLKQGVLTGVWVYKYSAFPNYWSGTTIGWGSFSSTRQGPAGSKADGCEIYWNTRKGSDAKRWSTIGCSFILGVGFSQMQVETELKSGYLLIIKEK